jgi:hypothetical protein
VPVGIGRGSLSSALRMEIKPSPLTHGMTDAFLLPRRQPRLSEVKRTSALGTALSTSSTSLAAMGGGGTAGETPGSSIPPSGA